ncbi:hypothetical protein [Microbacterium gorillae]|uniref:hypothetical protein n=1 Tax=Microbacterium gorillae TaxID=1231063 RepID=UPI000693AF4D|nr:hypothetical protein [Microbacterium gorillae]
MGATNRDLRDVADGAVTLRAVRIPTSVESSDASDFLSSVQVRNRAYRETLGDDDEVLDAEALLSAYQPDAYVWRRLWLVVVGGEALGRVGLDVPNEEGSRSARAFVQLVPGAWSRGTGSAALRMLESLTRDAGRTLLQGWTEHPNAIGDRVRAPTGYGTLPDDHTTRFLRRRGYALQQIERRSQLVLGEDALARVTAFEAAARAHAGPDYDIVQWTLPTPPQLVDDYAWLKSRMATDVPSAGMDVDEDRWDTARVARMEAAVVGRTQQVTAARHRPSGRLCAFNELLHGPADGDRTFQEDTLVLTEHRGHRLGMLVKAVGLRAWHERAPEAPRVITWNAEENRPMLDINEALGFVGGLAIGAWQKDLSR